VSDVLADLLDAALTAARLTGGDVDPTVGAAMIALGYDEEFANVGPGMPLAASMTTPATWSMVTLHDRTVTMPRGVVLDLGATAKAVAADRCAHRVHTATGSGVLVNLGGDIATAGIDPVQGWPVLVHDGGDDPASIVHRRWRHGDALAHHIVDPRTGRSAQSVWRTVSVAAQTCFAANTVTTAAVVRGWRALEWIAALDVPARLVDADMVVHTVGGWPAPEGRR
jgi:thiamine biosynthesis lipoprotein